MHPAEAHTIFEDTLKRSRKGAIDWRIKETKSAPAALEFEAPARDGAHGVEIGSEHVEDHGTVYEFRVVDDAGEPLYEFALSHHAAAQGDLRTYEEFVELFTLAKHHAASRSGRTR
jgi:hypothetical protein